MCVYSYITCITISYRKFHRCFAEVSSLELLASILVSSLCLPSLHLCRCSSFAPSKGTWCKVELWFAVSADVSSNYLTLTGRQLIQTWLILNRNEGRREEKKRSEGKKGIVRGAGGREGERENSFPCECSEPQCKC